MGAVASKQRTGEVLVDTLQDSGFLSRLQVLNMSQRVGSIVFTPEDRIDIWTLNCPTSTGGVSSAHSGASAGGSTWPHPTSENRKLLLAAQPHAWACHEITHAAVGMSRLECTHHALPVRSVKGVSTP